MENKQIVLTDKPVLLNLIQAPEKYYQTLVISSPSQAILSHSIPIGLLPKVINNGEIFVKALLIKIIRDVVNFLNVGKTMNEIQVIQTVDLICSEYPFFKFEDFKLCFNNAKIGKYGISYDRVDGQIIFEWLNIYSGERALEAERMNINTHASQIRNESEKVDINPEGQKKVIEILKSVLETKPQVMVKKELYKKSPRDEFISKCFLEHFSIWEKSPAKDKVVDGTGRVTIKDFPGRYIIFNGKPVDEVEYTNEKLKQYDLTNLQK